MGLCLIGLGYSIYGVLYIRQANFFSDNMLWISVGIMIVVVVLAGILLSRKNKISKMYEPVTLAILSPAYFKMVMESASSLGKVKYETAHSMPMWYYSGFMGSIENKGFMVRSFRLTAPEPSGIAEIDDIPITPEAIFVSESLYLKISAMKSHACLVQVDRYGTAMYKNPRFGIFPAFVFFASTFLKEVEEKELRKIQGVDAFMASVKLDQDLFS